MDQIKIGKFIARLRKGKNMTQQNLADKLGVSFKTISKWETGKGMPDLSILQKLCEELGISINDLLYGDIIDSKNFKKVSEENLINNTKFITKLNLKKIYVNSLTFMYLLSIVICLICDLSINKKFTWFPIVLVSIAIGYCITVLPILLRKKRSIIILSIVTVLTYLLIYIICSFVNGDWLWNMGYPIVTTSFLFIWMLYLVFILKIKTLLKVSFGTLIIGTSTIVINSLVNSHIEGTSILSELSRYFTNDNDMKIIGNKIAFYCALTIFIFTFLVHVSSAISKREKN